MLLRLAVGARRLWRRGRRAAGGLRLLDATLGARSLTGEITRLGLLLLVAGLGVSLIAAGVAQRSSADDLADFDLIDFLDQEVAPTIEFCQRASDPSCMYDVTLKESRGLWRIEVGGKTYRSITFAQTEASLSGGDCAREDERRIDNLMFFTCRLGEETAFRVVERRDPPALAAIELALWQEAADRAGKRQVGGHGLRLAVAVMALALVLAMALALLATRRRLTRHFRRLDEALERYRLGDAATVEGAFPSEIQALADSLNRAIARKSALMDRQRRYVAKMAHDLRHQLVAIDLAARPKGEDEKAGREGGDIDREDLDGELATLNGLVERYLTLTDWVGPTEGAPPVDVREALAATGRAFSRRLRIEPLEIEIDCPEGVRLRAHPADLRIILSNLVGNAHRFAASKIRLGARTVTRDASYFEGEDADDVEILVEDDGPGIPPERRAQAIAWGGRLDAAPAGSGFGMSIVAEQVSELYGGELRLEESELGGLAAVVRLPSRQVR